MSASLVGSEMCIRARPGVVGASRDGQSFGNRGNEKAAVRTRATQPCRALLAGTCRVLLNAVLCSLDVLCCEAWVGVSVYAVGVLRGGWKANSAPAG
eukprot:9354081-Alexandrium_andersonii.AAC.1